jgi:DNA polymerase III sliding clamp (beta) subunit (PCNA family)
MMEFTIDQAPFAQALRQTRRGLSKRRSFSPSAAYVLLVAEGDRVTLVTYKRRLRVEVVLTAGVEVVGAGDYAAHHAQLLEAVEHLDGRLRVQVGEQGLLVDGLGELQRQVPVAGLPAGALPACPLVAEAGVVSTVRQTRAEKCPTCGVVSHPTVADVYHLDDLHVQRVRLGWELLVRLLELVRWAAADGDVATQRPVLDGVALELEGGRFALMAGDGFCSAIAQEQLEGESASWPRVALAPTAPLARAVKMLPRGAQVLVEATFGSHRLIKQGEQVVEDGPVTVRPALLRLSTGGLSVTIPLKEETPIEYRAVIPAVRSTRAVCERADLLSAVEAVLGVALEESGTVSLSLGDSLRVEARSSTRPAGAVYEVPLSERAGPPLRMQVSPGYLLAQLSALSERQVSIEVADTQGGDAADFVLRPCSDQEHYLCVVRARRLVGTES